VVSPAKLQANSASALVYVARALGGGFWAKMMALAIALSVIATTGTGIVLSARIEQNSPSTQRWSLIAIVALGLLMLRSPFFSIRRESDNRQADRQPGRLTGNQAG
jgi:hypothetical protein